MIRQHLAGRGARWPRGAIGSVPHLRAPGVGLRHLDADFERTGQQHFMRGDPHVVEPGLGVLPRNPAGQLAVADRSCRMRKARSSR